MHPKQLHTGSERGCSCNCRTIPLCCCFQLLHRRRQHCSLQKLLTAKAVASVSQERPGGTKTLYMRGQRTSHQQEGEFSAFPVLFPLSCIPPSVQGTELLSKAGFTMCSFSPASFIPVLRDILPHRACWSQHVGSSSLPYSGETLGRMEEKASCRELGSPPLWAENSQISPDLELQPLWINTCSGPASRRPWAWGLLAVPLPLGLLQQPCTEMCHTASSRSLCQLLPSLSLPTAAHLQYES